MINRFTFTWMNHRKDIVLDTYLKAALKSGIKSAKATNKYHITIIFNDGLEMIAWNTNKYYAWLSSGKILLDNSIIYYWDGGRPSRKTMAKLYKALQKTSYNN